MFNQKEVTVIQRLIHILYYTTHSGVLLILDAAEYIQSYTLFSIKSSSLLVITICMLFI